MRQCLFSKKRLLVIKLLIISSDSEIKEKHIEIARQNQVNIMRTAYDTYHYLYGTATSDSAAKIKELYDAFYNETMLKTMCGTPLYVPPK